MAKLTAIPVQKPIRVFVCDTSRMGTQLLCDVLGRDRRFAPEPTSTLDEISSVNADIGLVALTAVCESFTGSGLIREIVRRRPDIRIVVLIENSSRETVTDALRSGARGVFCRSEPLKLLGKCIASVHNGQVWANQKEIDYLLQSLADPIPIRLVDAKGAALLSAREQDVVRWVAEGLTNREIADRLNLSEHTVKNYLFRIFEKLGISNRMELILYVVSQLRPRHSGEAAGANHVAPQARSKRSSPEETVPYTSLPAYDLGQRYLLGQGVPADPVTAYMWLQVAQAVAGQISVKASSALRELGRSLTPEQMAESQRRSAEWLARANSAADNAETPDKDESFPKPSVA